MFEATSEMGFDKLKGIGRSRTVVEAGPRAELEMLLKAGKTVGALSYELDESARSKFLEARGLLRGELDGVEYDWGDLCSLINIEAFNQDYRHTPLRGVLSGVLLDLLAERKKERGEETRFYINGNGMTFDYLFTYAQNFGTLVVDGFEGIGLLSDIGSSGKNHSLAVLNCRAHQSSEIANHLAFNGSMRQAVFVNNRCGTMGYSTLATIGLYMGADNLRAYSQGFHPVCECGGNAIVDERVNKVIAFYDPAAAGDAPCPQVHMRRTCDATVCRVDGNEVEESVAEARYDELSSQYRGPEFLALAREMGTAGREALQILDRIEKVFDESGLRHDVRYYK